MLFAIFSEQGHKINIKFAEMERITATKNDKNDVYGFQSPVSTSQ